MKKLLITSLVLLSLNTYSQINFNKKQIKVCLTVSGCSIAAGSIISVIRTYKEQPKLDNTKATEKYNQNQKDLQRLSSMFYGIGGVSLVCICFNF